MTLQKIVEHASDKENFTSLDNYLSFALNYLEFIKYNLQAVIVSRNENNYQFFQRTERALDDVAVDGVCGRCSAAVLRRGGLNRP